MKLTSVFNQEILEEGLKFGNREIRMVKSIATEVIIGIEYEYDVDVDGDVDYESEGRLDAIYQLALDLMQDDIKDQKENWMDNFVESEMDNFEIGSITSYLHTMKNLYINIYPLLSDIEMYDSDVTGALGNWDMDNWSTNKGFESSDDLRIIEKYLANISKVRNILSNVSEAADDIALVNGQDGLGYIAKYVSGSDRDIENDFVSFKDSLESYLIQIENAFGYDMEDKHDMETFVDVLNDDFTTIDDINTYLTMVGEITGDDNAWDEEVKEYFISIADDRWDEDIDSVLEYDTDNVYETEFYDTAREEVDNSGDFPNDKVAYIETTLRDDYQGWGIDYNREIEVVKEDGSVPEGVETVSNPLPLNATFSLMKKMFNHISDVGSTGDHTGMHVNLSIKGMHYKRDNFNTTKLLLLLDTKMLQEFFGLRGNIADQFDGLNMHTVFDIAGGRNTNEIIELFEQNAFKRVKHQQVSFVGLEDKNEANVSTDRIEFRYVGGKDYEKRYNTIEWNIYRLTYMTLCAFSESFGHKEYLTEMYKILDDWTQVNYVMSFNDMVTWRKHNRGESVEELNTMMNNNERSRLHTRINNR